VADINVERKGPSIWPWIVGLLVVALLAWALIEMFGRGEMTQGVIAPDTPAVGQEATPPPPALEQPVSAPGEMNR
jgi:hypothetical protein